MNRSPERAWLIAVAAGAGWVVLGIFALVRGIDPKRLERKQAVVAHAARYSMRAAAQSLVQLCIFFSVPFFARASSVPAHHVLVGLLVVVGGCTLWDPLYSALLDRPPAGAALQAIAAFAGLDCVLPVLGLSNRMSLAIAALTAAAGLPLATWLTYGRLKHTLAAFVFGALLPIGLYFGGARFVPPAPLRLNNGAIGTKIVERQLIDPATTLAIVPDQLVCFTAIEAPRGLRDQIRHVWRKDKLRISEIAVDVRGGRTQGFRTWSFKHNLAPGLWTCTVETESGQLLGRLSIHLGP